MNARLALALSLSALLGACINVEPVQLSYYLLNGRDGASAAPVDPSVPALVLESITLAEYLEQSGLVLQQGDNQLQVSRSHLWAEGLDVAVPEALLRSLRAAAPNYRYFLRGSDFVPAPTYALRLYLDAFHATDSSEVVAGGRYQIVDVAAGREVLNREFNLRQALRDDGYPQAVRQLRELLDQLARDIGGELQDVR
ncbi:MAG: ABC-type transport auxiliary lipoprotein family protein [Pseudomonadales bacterium]|jgi:uncharacterized lipoprotein YmbA|nr:ABC-type transport auxiliary lipoprotein family protein [Pseudomonadales bacterium]